MPSKSPSFTLRHEFAHYRDSARLKSCAESTQREYLRVIEHLEYEVGDVVTCSMDRAWIRDRRDEWAAMGHRAASIRLQVLKNALEPAISDGLLDAALFEGQQRVKRPHGLPQANVAWTEEEFELIVDDCISTGAMGLARALGLARYAGLRRQTICTVTESARYAKVMPGGQVQHRIRYRADKGEVWTDLIEDGRLTELLDERTNGNGEQLSFNKRYQPWKVRQLDQALNRLLTKRANEGLVRSGLTLHGLRHARGVELAEAGASDAEIMAQLAHTDEQSARVYRRQASRNRLGDRAQWLIDQHRAQSAARTPDGNRITKQTVQD